MPLSSASRERVCDSLLGPGWLESSNHWLGGLTLEVFLPVGSVEVQGLMHPPEVLLGVEGGAEQILTEKTIAEEASLVLSPIWLKLTGAEPLTSLCFCHWRHMKPL